MEIDEIKRLGPKERIKRLKELEEKRKEEIDEARKMITESEHEIIVDEIKRDIPIPEMTAIDPSTLFGETDKDMWRSKQYAPRQGKKEDESGVISQKAIEELEDLIVNEKTQKDMERSARAQQYTAPLEQIKQGNERLADIYSEIKEDPSRMQYMREEIHKIEENMERIQQYKNLDDATREEMDISERMISGIRGAYKR